jgi:hypothetical protein
LRLLHSGAAPQANAKALALKLELREPVLCDKFDEFAQLVHVERRFRPTRLLLLLVMTPTRAFAPATAAASALGLFSFLTVLLAWSLWRFLIAHSLF